MLAGKRKIASSRFGAGARVETRLGRGSPTDVNPALSGPREGPEGEKIARARRECQFRAGVFVLTPELPPELALQLQLIVMAVGESWLEQHGAPESVIGAYVAFRGTVEHCEQLLAASRGKQP